MPKHVPFIKPQFPKIEEVIEDLKLIYKNNYYSNNGPVYFKFIEAMESYIGQDLHAVALNNATSAIMLAMKACFDSDKKYVAMPSFTFPAGPLSAEWCGFEPLFFDIDLNTLQPSLDSLKEVYEKYGKEIAGILLVNEYGIGNEEIDDWERLSKELDIPMIIDSAPGIGSQYTDGKLLGGRGICEIFSMHATKPFGIGEGGLITTRDKSLADKLESLKNFGFNNHKLTDKSGMNGKITELDCAIGIRILENYDDILKNRRNVYTTYEKLLESSPVGFIPHSEKASIQFATILVDEGRRDGVIEELKKNNVEARTYYGPALHHHPLFKDYPKAKLRNTEEVSEQVVSLPVHNDMTLEIIEFICGVVQEALHD